MISQMIVNKMGWYFYILDFILPEAVDRCGQRKSAGRIIRIISPQEKSEGADNTYNIFLNLRFKIYSTIITKTNCKR